jgi:hypothetical protein
MSARPSEHDFQRDDVHARETAQVVVVRDERISPRELRRGQMDRVRRAVPVRGPDARGQLRHGTVDCDHSKVRGSRDGRTEIVSERNRVRLKWLHQNLEQGEHRRRRLNRPGIHGLEERLDGRKKCRMFLDEVDERRRVEGEQPSPCQRTR